MPDSNPVFGEERDWLTLETPQQVSEYTDTYFCSSEGFAVPFANVGGIFRNLTSQVSLVELTPEDAAKIERLAREIQTIYDRAAKKPKSS